MAATQVVIVYGTAANHVDALIIPSSDGEIPIHLNNLQQGQSAFAALHTDLRAKGHNQLLANFTNKPVVTKAGTLMPAAVIT